jgi:hypothetical protein
MEFAKRLFRRGEEISPLPIRLWKVEKSLFQLHLLQRGMKRRISVTSKDEILKRFSVHLLWLLKKLPPWSIEKGQRNADIELISKMMELGSDSYEWKTWTRMLDDLRLNHHLSLYEINLRSDLGRLGVRHFYFYLIYNFANRWNQIKSYKIYDDYESFLESFNISHSAVRNLTYKNLINKRLRPLVTKGLLREVSDYWLVANTKPGVNNTSKYRYDVPVKEDTRSSGNKVMTVGQSYSSFSEMIDNMNGWISIKVKDMFLDSRETLEQQNVLQLYNVVKDFNLSEEVLTDLDDWVLSQLNQLDIVSEED